MKYICLLFLLLASSVTMADTRYVLDQLLISMRDGPDAEAQSIKTLRTGDVFEVLEEQDDQLHIKLPDGTEGWVRTKYTSQSPPASMALADLQQKFDRVQAANTELKSQLAQIKDELGDMSKTKNQLERQSSKASKDLERLSKVAAKPLELEQLNQELITQNEKLTSENDLLKSEIGEVSQEANRGWFMAGAGVVVLGLAIGLIIPRIRWRRRSSYW
ncbi:MAG: TIGR04211 family SH3 domain-containing protein [Gammaproteobacteria bacterium]|nr:TIGR04211 family SH3 domain-containing protein [Gammaproteobacteria bacterium]